MTREALSPLAKDIFTPFPSSQVGNCSYIGWLPAKYRRWLNMLRYWNRLVALDSGRITRAVFEHDYRLGRNNWCNEVKCIMSALNLVDCFNEKRIVNLENARSRMTAYYGQLWCETVESSPKLQTSKLCI